MMKFLFLVLFSSIWSAQIQLGNEILTVEIADTHETRAKGLMGRPELQEGHGMLFVYKTPEIAYFWMKDTLIPLSLGYFSREKRLIQIIDMDPPKGGRKTDVYPSNSPILYALEVPQGWFKKHGIEVGTTFSFVN